MTTAAEPFESFPFASTGLGPIVNANIYIIMGKDGTKKQVEAASVSEALRQVGMHDALRVDRFDPMNQTLLGLEQFSATAPTIEVPLAAEPATTGADVVADAAPN